MDGTELPMLLTSVPGPRSRARVDVLARHECPAITARRVRRAAALGTADDDPIVWDTALGAVVQDVDGNRFVDLTSAFAVNFLGHRHPSVVQAAKAQSDRLLHAMGDAWPDDTRIRLLERLASLAPSGLEVAILGLSGSDAIEVCVKTALLATGRRGVLTFEGGYHGLALGAVALQQYSPAFTEPFRGIVHPEVHALPWGCPPEQVAETVRTKGSGLVLVEPIQGRGGVRTPPSGWHAGIAAASRTEGALFAFDEIYTGFGRTGVWFAGTTEGVIPDLLCVGKSLAGGFPLSACLGSRAVMNAWGSSSGEAIHTQTFLGHPVGCAAALAVLDQLEHGPWVALAAENGARYASDLTARGWTVRGRGLMLGIEHPKSLALTRALLRRGFLTLPAGAKAEVLGITPPVTLADAQWLAFVEALDASIQEVG